MEIIQNLGHNTYVGKAPDGKLYIGVYAAGFGIRWKPIAEPQVVENGDSVSFIF